MENIFYRLLLNLKFNIVLTVRPRYARGITFVAIVLGFTLLLTDDVFENYYFHRTVLAIFLLTV